jgi:tRNA/tmRNA/rRNA uracil-C5-methylase (TrmA/RlmC/RlmD family)
LELFCGSGNLTFDYLDLVKRVWGVDASQAAVETARRNREKLGTDKVIFFSDKVDRFLLRRLPPEAKDYDTLILDPPRQGTLNSLPGFLHNQLKTIVYISCSPLTFSQDVQCLKKEFTLKRIEPIDMFPQTRHIEFISTWVRS